MKKTLGKFLEYVLIRMIVSSVNLLPFRFRRSFFIGLARLLARILPKIKKRLHQNISLAFPEKEQDFVEELSRTSIDALGLFLAEFTQVTKITPSFIQSYTKLCSPLHEIKKVYEEGGLVILGHLGNWELQGAALNFLTGKSGAVMAKRQSNFWSNQWIEKTRERYGMHTIYSEGGPREVIQVLRDEKKGVAMVADQDAGKNGLLVDFMGIKTPTFRGPAFIARTTGCPVYFGYSRHHEGKLEMYVEALELPGFDPKIDPKRWELEFTQAWSAKLEEKIRENPGEYFWAHNRWKNAPR